ncbi:MAG: hypothetical protein Q7K40_05000 [bacterium]|nr:hypothetical protein [bacterium]
MKALIVLLLLVVSGVAQADTQLKIENGELLTAFTEWRATGVKVTPEAQKYSQFAEEAFLNPGKGVVVEQGVRVTPADLFHYRVDKVNTKSVRYDDQKAEIDVVLDSKVTKTEERFSPFFIFWIIAVVAFFVATRMKAPNPNLPVLSFCAVILAMVMVVFTSAIGSTIPLAFAAIGSLALVVPTLNGKQATKSIRAPFYILMFFAVGVVYYPLLS